MTIQTNIPLDYFPSSVLEMADLIGLANTFVLVRAYGGTTLEIPQKNDKRPELAALVGVDGFASLVRYYGGTKLEIPRCTKLKLLARDITLLGLKQQNLTIKTLAAKFSMTERGIFNALRHAKKYEAEPWLSELLALLQATP